MTPRLYLLHGTDEYAGTEFVDELKSRVAPDPGTAALNIALLDGRTVALADIQSACGAMPFLADQRLTIVEGWITRLQGKAEEGEVSESGKATLAALIAYLPDLPETATLVLLERRDLSERGPLFKALAQLPWAKVRKFDVPQGDALVDWIRKRARHHKGEITPAAARALAEAEHEPRALGNEIEKLLTYVAWKRPVEVDDVQALTKAGVEARVFDFVDHLGLRRAQPALRELHALLEHEDAGYVLAMITRQYRLLIQTKELVDSHASPNVIAQTLGLHPYPAGKLSQQTKNYTLAGLEQLYRQLFECEIDVKTGRMDPLTALDVLVSTLATA